MCLISVNSRPLVAESDIPCYKVVLVKKNFWFWKKYLTPIEQMRVYTNSIVEAEGDMDYGYCEYQCIDHFTSVKGGFIHTFATVKAAESFIEELRKDNNLDYTIIEGYIPEGIHYFDSISEDRYASTCIILKDVIW